MQVKRSILIVASFVLSLTCVFNTSFAASMKALTPVGTWQTIDDHSNKPRSIVVISEDKNGELSGKIEKILSYREGEGPGDVCDKCSGSQHNKPILGLKILWGLTQNGPEWEGGRILDPENGREYSCKMNLDSDGRALNVRGFIGISLIGRTQTWVRVKAKPLSRP